MALNIRVIGAVVASVLMVTLAAAVLLNDPSESHNWPDGDLPAFESEAQLDSYLKARGTSAPGWMLDTGSDKAEGAGANYHSGTNVQVSGVDEMDRIKTDGRYIFIASSDRVNIVRAYPADSMSNASTITIGGAIDIAADEQGFIQGIYLYGDRLIVICSLYAQMNNPSFLDVMWWMPMEERTVAFVVDVSDPEFPEVISEGGVSGYVVGTRMIDSRIYMITQESVWQLDDIDLPSVWNDGEVKDVGIGSILFDPNATRVSTFTNFCVMDAADGTVNTTSILTDYSSVLYVSTNSIYLTFIEWNWQGATDGDDAAISSDGSEVTTKLFRLAMSGSSVVPTAMGEVDGYPLNQFSLDENKGFLRIATCSGWTERENMVFVLDQELVTVGSLRGIAPDETIQAARFIDDTLYLVTFLQTDPLFVIDLSDPESPRIMGELTVPGFSSYLHPIDEGRLIGIGMENGTLKVSLYDVSVPEAPREVMTVMTGTWAWSSAQWDHKAVLYDSRYGILAIPVYTYDEGGTGSAEEMFLYSVSAEGIELTARLSNGGVGSSPRGVIIEDVLYTITTTTMVAWNIANLDMIGSLTYAVLDAPLYWYAVAEAGVAVR